MSEHLGFGARLRDRIDARGPVCVGIDPHPALMDQWGMTDSVLGLERFAAKTVDAVGTAAAAVKPQSAFFERHGSRGIAVLERTIAQARALGTLVVLDVKRGDIGSTAQAYADAYLDQRSPLAVDAVTANPFLGIGSLDPMIDTALANDAGVFLLARTSNTDSAQVQHATTEDGRSVAAAVLAAVAARNAGSLPWGSIGAVVGATIEESREDLDVNGPLLVPGIGTQGGRVADVRRVFGAAAGNVLASSSREILSAGPDRTSLRAATERLAEELAAVTSA